jgi:hypothetical protein
VRLIIVDEAARVDDPLYYSIRPMLAVSGGRMVCLTTPFGKRGFFYEEWTGDGPWDRIKITARECPRISAKFLDEERASLGEWWYQQEYECTPCACHLPCRWTRNYCKISAFGDQCIRLIAGPTGDPVVI